MMRHLTSEDIQNYLDGQFNDTKKGKFIEHIKQCLFCQYEFENYQQLYSVLEEEPFVNLSQGFDRKVMAQIEKITPEKSIFLNPAVLLYTGLSIWAGILISLYYTGLRPYVKLLSYSQLLIYKMMEPLYRLFDKIFSNAMGELSAAGLIIIFILAVVDYIIIQKRYSLLRFKN